MSILFDKRDRDLLKIVNGVLSQSTPDTIGKKGLFPWFHPHGIKELAETRGLRIAYAVIHLLKSLDAGDIEDRLNALRSLRDEVLHASAGSMPKNAARVLLSIMKDLVRAHGDETEQLRLAHDFRRVASGMPRIVRAMLRRYHLLEMPEAWNQLGFDDHVHDINTKGRKSASHLIMDAWIKGIRRLRVIYYNFIDPPSAAELLEAAKIMGVQMRIGIEFSARFHNKYIQLIWVPRGFHDAQSFLCFLAEEPVRQLMDQGREVTRYRQRYVLEILEAFNRTHRRSINADLGIDLPPLDAGAFLNFVRPGQPSILHLAKYIHRRLMPLMQRRVENLREAYVQSDERRRQAIATQVARLNDLDSESIVQQFLRASANPEIPNPNQVRDDPDTPALLCLSPRQLLERVTDLHTGFRVTLNLTDLLPEDVVEILYDCDGLITRLEIFNLKDYTSGKAGHIEEISELQLAINQGNAINLKRMIRNMVKRLATAPPAEGKTDRIEKLGIILHDISAFSAMYAPMHLEPRLGSDSTGHSARMYGMGLAILESLPSTARRLCHKEGQVVTETAPHAATVSNGPGERSGRRVIPFQIPVYKRITYVPYESPKGSQGIYQRLLQHLPMLKLLGKTRQLDWLVQPHMTRMVTNGNVVTLGGIANRSDNGLRLLPEKNETSKRRCFPAYLNSKVSNGLKILLGFIPAFLSFYLTNDWWVLAYLGAFIWFGITGVRNIVQSVLGGGGIGRSPLLHWNEYVSWVRISDSLLFTGFSVPLLDFLVKTVLLDRLMGVTTATNPMLLYTVMAVANGIYLSGHNLFRGFPRGAVYANFFRSVLSIPIAILFNMFIGAVMGILGVVGIEGHLQKWAAVISKAASDTVAGIIEGTVDRFSNIEIRFQDYADTLSQLFATYGQLETQLPELNVWETLDAIEQNRVDANTDTKGLEKLIVIGALDLLYFWMYQPRARTAFKYLFKTLSDEEKRILAGCQAILKREREISQMFIDGVVGMNFSKGLSFYLQCAPGYLKAMHRLLAQSAIGSGPGGDTTGACDPRDK
ncbi:hypothetical protein DSCO28_26480 [Desulfosarcina ovata subsp. sediminis]|uniref:Uncharacterized protein n=1 Tax=Desulfosarcina ovata subsp. sediminis TaxID=885957 RepID=A0A5K7ZIX6_9BACT|nr:hypothetical protein [Desulfosarcina ovata]BBO82082.1 hypothetical protein DSCO28_26480 [Desulfosarcina ovata subsp. sediminis]